MEDEAINYEDLPFVEEDESEVNLIYEMDDERDNPKETFDD